MGLQQRSDGLSGWAERELSFVEFRKDRFGLFVPPDFSVTEMLAGHQYASGRSANRGAAVVVRPAHAFAGQAIDVGGRDFFLAIAPDIPPSEIICQDEDDVGWNSMVRTLTAATAATCLPSNAPQNPYADEEPRKPKLMDHFQEL
jgi:hypothetical protein